MLRTNTELAWEKSHYYSWAPHYQETVFKANHVFHAVVLSLTFRSVKPISSFDAQCRPSQPKFTPLDPGSPVLLSLLAGKRISLKGWESRAYKRTKISESTNFRPGPYPLTHDHEDAETMAEEVAPMSERGRPVDTWLARWAPKT